MAAEVGQAIPLSSLALNNVLLSLVVPLASLSINHLAKTLNCFTLFYSDFFVIQDLSTTLTLVQEG